MHYEPIHEPTRIFIVVRAGCPDLKPALSFLSYCVQTNICLKVLIGLPLPWLALDN